MNASKALAVVLASIGGMGIAPIALGKDASQDEVVICMWSKMPTSTLAFVENGDRSKELELFVAAASRCSLGNSSLNFNKMRKKLQATKLTQIGPDTMRADNVFVCTPKVGAGEPACHAPGGQ